VKRTTTQAAAAAAAAAGAVAAGVVVMVVAAATLPVLAPMTSMIQTGSWAILAVGVLWGSSSEGQPLQAAVMVGDHHLPTTTIRRNRGTGKPFKVFPLLRNGLVREAVLTGYFRHLLTITTSSC
jgi:hypothetical protein